MAGILALAFNPHAWVAVGLTALVAFSGGVVKGWNASSADQWRKTAIAAQQAAKDKERLSEEDRRRAEIAENEMLRLDAALEGVIHNAKTSTCSLAPAELDQLRVLAGSGNSRQR